MNTDAPIAETYEPEDPINWPYGHVAITRAIATREASFWLTEENVAVEITDDTVIECIAITLGNTRHFLHSTTARELSNMLLELNEQPVTIRIHNVSHSADGATAGALSKALIARLDEWNRIAVAEGAFPV